MLYFLDSLGPGSIIGANYTLYEEKIPYTAKIGANCEIFIIPRTVLEEMYE